MADPATISATFSVPIFLDILHAIQGLRTEVRENGDKLEARLQAIEARLPVAPLDIISVPDLGHLSPTHITNHDNAPFESTTNDISLSRSDNVQDASIRNVDDGLTIVHEPMPAQASQPAEPIFAPYQTSPTQHMAEIPRPRAGRPFDVSELGKKRKRAVGSDLDEPGRTPVLVTGFQMRTSEAQIQENKREAFDRSREPTPANGPTASESPFDRRTVKSESTSDGLEYMPPVHPRPQASMPPQRPRPKAPRDERPQTSQPTQSTLEHEDFPDISRNGRLRQQRQLPPGFVALPTLGEINRGSRRTRQGR